jgi:hypothetical protein
VAKRLPRHLRSTRDSYRLDRWPNNRLCDKDRYFGACERAIADIQALSEDTDVPHEVVVKMLAIFVHADEGFATFVRDNAQEALDLDDDEEWAQIDETAAWLLYIAWQRSREGDE